MKTNITLLLITFCSASFAQGYDAKTKQEIKTYVSELYTAAESENTKQLEQLIYNDGSDAREILIKEILKNDQSSSGDFAYSHRALKLVADSLYVQFKPIPEGLKSQLANGPDMHFLKNEKNENIPIFDYKKAHIVLLKGENGYQLVFWESMNNLLRP